MKTKTVWDWAKFDEWDAENPHVYEELILEAIARKAAGAVKGAIWHIVQDLRWESGITTTGEDFKIPNNSFAFYARKIMHYRPEFVGFFDIKPLKCGERDEWPALPDA